MTATLAAISKKTAPEACERRVAVEIRAISVSAVA